MLPDVDADDGDVREQRVLVGRRRDLEHLRLRVVALQRTIRTDRRAHASGPGRQPLSTPRVDLRLISARKAVG